MLRSWRLIARELETVLGGRLEALTGRLGREGTARALRCARVVVQRLEMDAAPDDFSIRDRAMAENALWALEQEGPQGRIVLWAHNGHVATVPESMGHEVRLALGEDLRVIGFAFSEGAFQTMGLLRGSGLTTWMAPPAPEGTLDALLAEARLQVAAFDLRALPAKGPVAEWLSGRRSTRSIGSVYGPELEAESFDPRPVRDMYDALIFVKQTSEAGAGRHGRSMCVAGTRAGRSGEAWGGASQMLDPAPYIGRRVRLSGWVRTEGAMEAHMKVAPDSADFSQLAPGTASSSEGSGWQHLLAETDVDNRAVSLTLSVGAEGVGSACFDDLALEVLPASPQAE